MRRALEPGRRFNMGAGQRSITRNPRTPEGHTVPEDLIRTLEVRIESPALLTVAPVSNSTAS
jgi:hypothetical protein